MKPIEVMLRGYVVPDGGSYFAICLELNIYARGETYEEAAENCFRYICEYVEEALTDDAEHAGNLLRRRAPMKFWLRYWYVRLMYRIFPENGDTDSKQGGIFKRPLPLLPAC